MKRGAFIFDGVPSEEIKTLIQTRPMLEAPTRKVESRSAFGVDGDIPFDEGAYNNTALELMMVIDGDDLIADRQKFYDLIDTRGKYKDFIPYFDPDKIYRVRTESTSFENQYFFGEKQTASVKLTVKPYKYLVDNGLILTPDPVTTVNNPTRYVSQPRWFLRATGDVTITVNGVPFILRDVPGNLVIDSERFLTYHVDAAVGTMTRMNNKVMTREYPILQPGTNNITVTGAATGLDIEPRWRSLV